MHNNPLLYSYRRCPYAMRARMALVLAQIQCNIVEIDFKNKPQAMLDISPKGTVPVLKTLDGLILDESLDIMRWALSQNDPQMILQKGAEDLIAENDGSFKSALDRFKYPNRFPDEDCSQARENALLFIDKLNQRLLGNAYLLEDKLSIADIAIFPFIRQFVNVDKAWFESLRYKPLQLWLQKNIDSDLFQKIIQKENRNLYLLI